jgi:hypothetical protein
VDDLTQDLQEHLRSLRRQSCRGRLARVVDAVKLDDVVADQANDIGRLRIPKMDVGQQKFDVARMQIGGIGLVPLSFPSNSRRGFRNMNMIIATSNPIPCSNFPASCCRNRLSVPILPLFLSRWR